MKSHPGLCHGRPAASRLEGVFIGDLPPTLEAAVLQQKLVEEVGSMLTFNMGSGGPQIQGMQWATVEFAEKGAVARALAKVPTWVWQTKEGPMPGVLHHCSCRPLASWRSRR